jgi:hypothetical protein
MDSDVRSTIRVPGEPTLTKTANIPVIEVELPASYWLSDSKPPAWVLVLPVLILMIFVLIWLLPAVWSEYFQSKQNLMSTLFETAFCVYAMLGVAVMGISTVWSLYVFSQKRGPVLKLDKEGFQDLRVSPDLICWKDVAAAKPLNGPYAGYSLKLILIPTADVRLYGPQGLNNWLSRRNQARQIIIDIKSLSSDKWVAHQAILHLVNAAQSSAAKMKRLM